MEDRGHGTGDMEDRGHGTGDMEDRGHGGQGTWRTGDMGQGTWEQTHPPLCSVLVGNGVGGKHLMAKWYSGEW